MTVWDTTKSLHYASVLIGLTYIFFDKSSKTYRQSGTLRIVITVLYFTFIISLIVISVSFLQDTFELKINLSNILKIIDSILWTCLNIVAILQLSLNQSRHLSILNDMMQVEKAYELFLIHDQNKMVSKIKLPIVLTVFLAFLGIYIPSGVYMEYGHFVLMSITLSILRTQLLFYYEIALFLQFEFDFKGLNYNLEKYPFVIRIRDIMDLYEKLYELMMRLARACQALKLISLSAMVLQISNYAFGVLDFENFILNEHIDRLSGGLAIAVSIICCFNVVVTCHFWGAALDEVSALEILLNLFIKLMLQSYNIIYILLHFTIIAKNHDTIM